VKQIALELDYYNKTIVLYPKNAEAHQYKAEIMCWLKHYDEALAEYFCCIALHHRSLTLLYKQWLE